MAAGKYNMIVQQGATYAQNVTLKNAAGSAVNIATGSAACQIKGSYTDIVPAATFTCGVPVGTDGVITLLLSAAQTSALTITTGVYDLELYLGGQVYRIMQGNVVVLPEVTK